ncbi:MULTISPECIES: hypothetical protein [unclassified Paenibacillus]|uniref:hypothetical protein n=1 Tax=unclassified Paenibacillus TaxID=185978 RepID=UPI000BA11D4D|nr:hypothetical protein [Paenibacillus sp. VTT E-133291]MBY3621236.1 hypothetical protein [Acinetobacter sp. CUI P1]OZQ97366.1 hypothetical protein CA598_06120 [Paenibacillus sp. VTT E-133291]
MSKHSIIRSELEGMQVRTLQSQTKSLFSTIFSSTTKKNPYIPVNIKIPEYDLLRAEVFLEDVMESIDREYEVSMIELTALLVKDFLRVTSTNTKLEELKNNLMSRRAEYLSTKEKVKEWVEVAPGHNALRERERVRRRRYFELQLEIPRKVALRAEIILYDLEQMYAPFQMTLEDLITILILDFVHQLQTGKQKEIVKKFVSSFC